jgi:hypothetical protein
VVATNTCVLCGWPCAAVMEVSVNIYGINGNISCYSAGS